jgi:hypothetical protein
MSEEMIKRNSGGQDNGKARHQVTSDGFGRVREQIDEK